MSLGKKDIAKDISAKALISYSDSLQTLESFLQIIVANSKKNTVKIANFGTFYMHSSPKRLGRNPKTKEEYFIPARKTLKFKPSNSSKQTIN